MHDKTHVGFINAHAKRHSGDHNIQIVADEGILYPGPFLGRQTRVIASRPDVAHLQQIRNFLRAFATGAINDTALPCLLLHIMQQLFGRFELFDQRIADIRTVKAGQMHERLMQAKAIENINAGGIIRRCR